MTATILRQLKPMDLNPQSPVPHAAAFATWALGPEGTHATNVVASGACPVDRARWYLSRSFWAGWSSGRGNVGVSYESVRSLHLGPLVLIWQWRKLR